MTSGDNNSKCSVVVVPDTTTLFSDVTKLDPFDPSMHAFPDTDLADNTTVDIWNVHRFLDCCRSSIRPYISREADKMFTHITQLQYYYMSRKKRERNDPLPFGNYCPNGVNLEDFILRKD
ncbi:hypothetical protein P9112_002067 [Eukaryota sp. TZLM1-RC]